MVLLFKRDPPNMTGGTNEITNEGYGGGRRDGGKCGD